MCNLFVVKLTAMPDQGCQFPAGQEYTSLVVAKAETRGDAEDIALVALTASCWKDATLIACQPVTADIATLQGVIGEAARYASDNGFALITYLD